MDAEKFGTFVQQQRKGLGLTQEQLGGKLNVTDKAVSRWERGECFPEITQLESIAEIFGITVGQLLSCNATPQNVLKMCKACKNKKCKENNYKELPHCQNGFIWAVYGISTAILLFITVLAYVIVCLSGNLWTVWEIPVIMVACYVVIVSISAMIIAIPHIKFEMALENNKKDTQTE